MAFDPTLKAALAQPVAHIFCAVEILHPDGAIRLLDGLGTLTIGGQIYVGQDPVFGGLGSIDAPDEGLGDEAPTFSIVLHQVNSAVAISLCKPEAQGAAVKVMFGAYDPMTGQVVGTPDVRLIGEVDVPTLSLNGESSGVSFECVSGFERFFEAEEGAYMSDSRHQAVWPGERGLEYLVDVELSMPWGANGQRPDVIRAGR